MSQREQGLNISLLQTLKHLLIWSPFLAVTSTRIAPTLGRAKAASVSETVGQGIAASKIPAARASRTAASVTANLKISRNSRKKKKKTSFFLMCLTRQLSPCCIEQGQMAQNPSWALSGTSCWAPGVMDWASVVVWWLTPCGHYGLYGNHQLWFFHGVPKAMGHRTLEMNWVVVPTAPAAPCIHPLSSLMCFSKPIASKVSHYQLLGDRKNCRHSDFFTLTGFPTIACRKFILKGFSICWDWSFLWCFLFLSHQRSYSMGMWNMKDNALINKILATLEIDSFRLTTYRTK